MNAVADFTGDSLALARVYLRHEVTLAPEIPARARAPVERMLAVATGRVR